MRSCFLIVALVVLNCSAASAAQLQRTSTDPPLEAVMPPQTNPHNFRTLHVFTGSPDGALPGAGLLYFNGTLYGATGHGGEGHKHFSLTGHGMIFATSPSGQLRPLYKFHDIPDGSQPNQTLVAMNGVLYGTTAFGGSGRCSGGCGTIFEVTTSGKERIIYNFQGKTDGYRPSSGLTVANGLLYGTTGEGGVTTGECLFGCGTVFEVSTFGRERLLYRFHGGPDGILPVNNLTLLNGKLYGATVSGGAGSEAGTQCPRSYPAGCGTIFELRASGTERILHRFSGSDGAYPVGGMVAIHGALYGTTSDGGDAKRGTVFSMTPAGEESILCDFRTAEGYDPSTPLLAVGGALYGMTQFGGPGPGSYGTVYKITASGMEQTVHGFDFNDGYLGESALIEVNGTIFGTTVEGGGAYNDGTIFSLSP